MRDLRRHPAAHLRVPSPTPCVHLAAGKVFRVKHLATGKLMVMKVIDKKEVIRDGVVHQLRREIEIHSRCRHENIVKFFCYFHDEERICIVLEYCNGKTLLDLMARQPQGRVNEEAARQFLQQLVSALTYLREGKAVPIIHRDIKPENILFVKNKSTGTLTLKLADFGWAVQHVPTSKRTTLCGTPEYLPPEVCLADRYSGAFDIWTLGVLMYEMLVGTTPFAVREDELEDDEDIQQAIVDKILSTKVIPVPDYFSDEARDLVLRLMDRNPSTRILLEEVARHPFLTGEPMPVESEDGTSA